MARKHLLAQGFSSQLATPDRAAGGAYCGGHHVQCCGCDLQRWRRPPLPSTTHVPVCDLPGCPFSLGQRPRQCTVATRGLTPSDGLLGSLQCPAAKTHAASSEVSPRHPGEVSRSMTAVSHVHSTHTWVVHVHVIPVPTLHLTRHPPSTSAAVTPNSMQLAGY